MLQVKEKQLTREEIEKKLTPKQRKFCIEYLYDYNATRSYLMSYKQTTSASAAVLGHNLLKNVNIQQYIQLRKNTIEENIGLSKQMLIKELLKISNTSFAHIHNTWITKNEFQDLPRDTKDSIQEIQTRTVHHIDPVNETPIRIEQVKIKFYSKVTAISEILKSMGWNEPDKLEIIGNQKQVTNIQVNVITDDRG